MKKRLIIALLVPIAFLLILFVWISGILNSKVSIEEEAVKKAKEKVPFERVLSSETFNGTKQYVTLHVEKDNGRQLFVIVPTAKKDEDVRIAFPSEGIKREKAIEIVKKERQPKEILDAKLGIENNIVAWGVSYINQNGQYEYYFLDFEEGIFIKRYAI